MYLNKIPLIFKTLLITQILLNLAYAGPRVVGNGGGGVITKGIYHSLGNSELNINSVEETDIPGMKQLLTTVLEIGGKSDSISNLLCKIIPSKERKYFRINENQISKNQRRKIYRELSKTTGVPIKELVLYAITDSTQNTTYLLPNFYKLKEIDQASILFHEAFWAMYPNVKYSQVLEGEVAYQKYIKATNEGGFDNKFPQIIAEMVSDTNISLRSAYQADVKLTTAPGLYNDKGQINISELFADNCKIYYNVVPRLFCSTLHFANSFASMIKLSYKYPNSFLLKEFINEFQRRSYSLSIEINTTDGLEGKMVPSTKYENLYINSFRIKLNTNATSMIFDDIYSE